MDESCRGGSNECCRMSVNIFLEPITLICSYVHPGRAALLTFCKSVNQFGGVFWVMFRKWGVGGGFL